MMGVKFRTKFTFTRSSQFSKLKLLLLLFSLSSVLFWGCLRLLHYGKFLWKTSNYFKAWNTGSLRNTVFETGKRLHYPNRVVSIWLKRIPLLTLYCFETLWWWNLWNGRSRCDLLLEWLIIVKSNILYLRHYNPLLIRNRSGTPTIHKAEGHST